MSNSPTPLKPRRPRRILIFSLAYYPIIGGAEVAIRELTDRISDIEFDVVTMGFNRAHPKVEKIGNCTVYRTNGGFSYLNKLLFIPRAALLALRLNKKNKYTAFWAMMTYMLLPITIMRWLGNKTPYALTLQDGDPFEHVFKRWRMRIFIPLLKYGFRHASVVQTISNFLAKWPERFGYRGKVEVIPNGVDLKKYLQPTVYNPQLEKDTVTLITTSRLVEKNGVRDIIEALRFLPENVELMILGTGPLEQKLKQLARRSLGEAGESRVKFLGHVEQKDIPKHLSSADIFVRPSLSEGQGISFIEAMASSLPVIATPVGGIPDFLFDPDKNKERPPTGLFCRVKDPESIAEQVKRLIKNKNLRDTIVGNARRMVKEKYDWDLIADQMKRRVFRPFF